MQNPYRRYYRRRDYGWTDQFGSYHPRSYRRYQLDRLQAILPRHSVAKMFDDGRREAAKDAKRQRVLKKKDAMDREKREPRKRDAEPFIEEVPDEEEGWWARVNPYWQAAKPRLIEAGQRYATRAATRYITDAARNVFVPIQGPGPMLLDF